MSVLAVSVALCTYNGERFLEAQLASILAQTSPPAEIVIADDGSTDGTLEVVARVAETSVVAMRVLPSVRRLGVTANFQRAVEACAGPLIALADQDDVWHLERLAAAAAVFDREPDVLLVHSDARLVDADGADRGDRLMASLRPTPDEKRILATGRPLAAYLRRNFVTGTTVTFRQSLLADAVPFPPSWVHDEWLATVAAIRGRVRYLDRALVDYRQHGANEIGMEAANLGQRIGRMREPRGDRLVRLADRARALAARFGNEPGEAGVSIGRKAAFEQRREAYPSRRVRRVAAVLRQAGSYPEFASQGRLDVIRDLVQPAGPRQRAR